MEFFFFFFLKMDAVTLCVLRVVCPAMAAVDGIIIIIIIIIISYYELCTLSLPSSPLLTFLRVFACKLRKLIFCCVGRGSVLLAAFL